MTDDKKPSVSTESMQIDQQSQLIVMHALLWGDEDKDEKLETVGDSARSALAWSKEKPQ